MNKTKRSWPKYSNSSTPTILSYYQINSFFKVRNAKKMMAPCVIL